MSSTLLNVPALIHRHWKRQCRLLFHWIARALVTCILIASGQNSSTERLRWPKSRTDPGLESWWQNNPDLGLRSSSNQSLLQNKVMDYTNRKWWHSCNWPSFGVSVMSWSKNWPNCMTMCVNLEWKTNVPNNVPTSGFQWLWTCNPDCPNPDGFSARSNVDLVGWMDAVHPWEH